MQHIDEEKKPRISAIAAISAGNRALGKGNELLWTIPEDLGRFRTLTRGHPVIMGRKTWESLPDAARPLPGRANFVITRQADYSAPGAIVVPSMEEALAAAKNTPGSDEIFIIGGGEIYTLGLPFTDRLYLTLVEAEKEADVFFPPYETLFTNIISDEPRTWGELGYRWVTLTR